MLDCKPVNTPIEPNYKLGLKKGRTNGSLWDVPMNGQKTDLLVTCKARHSLCS